MCDSDFENEFDAEVEAFSGMESLAAVECTDSFRCAAPGVPGDRSHRMAPATLRCVSNTHPNDENDSACDISDLCNSSFSIDMELTNTGSEGYSESQTPTREADPVDVVDSDFENEVTADKAIPTNRELSRKQLQFVLPLDFQNDIRKFVTNNSGGFVAHLHSNLHNRDDINSWMENFKAETSSDWITRTTKRNKQKKSQYYVKFVCQHSDYHKSLDISDRRARTRNCIAFISFSIGANNKPCKVVISWKHTHSYGAQIMGMRRVGKETQQRFDSYFRAGMSSTDARRYHTQYLLTIPGFTTTMFADSGVNPTARQVERLHHKFVSANVGGHDANSIIETLRRQQNDLAEAGNIVRVNEEPLVVFLATPIMQRAHRLVESQQIVFMDTTSNCDSTGTAITFLLCRSPIGGIPLGVFFSKGETAAEYACGLRLMTQAIPSSFNGQSYPSVVMKDDAAAESRAVADVWPLARQLLCSFHLKQSLWRHICGCEKDYPKSIRQTLINHFDSILRASTKEKAASCFEFAAEFARKRKLTAWEKRLNDYWLRRAEWCWYARIGLCYGNHTNNYAEACMRIFKDDILGRSKAHNMVDLLYYVTNDMSFYYRLRLLDFAHGRDSRPHLKIEKFQSQIAYLSKDMITRDGDAYMVPSSKDGAVLYRVHPDSGSCSCVAALYGRFCKHSAAVSHFFGVTIAGMPPVTARDRQGMFTLADGCSAVPPLAWFEDERQSSVADLTTPAHPHTLIAPTTSANCNGTAEVHTLGHIPANDQTDVPEFTKAIENLTARSRYFGLSTDPSFWRKFDHALQRTTTRQELYLLLNLMQHRVRRTRGYIKPQPTARSRRVTASQTQKVLQRGRLANGANNRPIVGRRKHDLMFNIANNRINARKHHRQ